MLPCRCTIKKEKTHTAEILKTTLANCNDDKNNIVADCVF